MSAARLVLATAFVVLLFNAGVRFSIGLMLKPMADDLAWTRSDISIAVTLFMVLSALALPFMGRLVDRFGAGRLLGVSVVVMSVGTAAMGAVQQPWEALLIYGVVVAIGNAGTSIAPVGVLVSRWFPERIGMANSIAISGMGVGQLVIILALSAYLTAFDWRSAFLALGAINVACVLPLLLFTAARAPDVGSVTPADGNGTAASGPAGAPATAAVTLSFRDVLRTRAFWWLALMYALCGFHDFLIATHFVAFALDQGLADGVAGSLFAFMGLAGLGGVLLGGVASDRWGPTVPTYACFVLRILLFAALLLSAEKWVIAAAGLIFGATFWVTAPLTVVFAREHFGLAQLGTVAGTITMVHHTAGGLAAVVGAAIYDRTQSYSAAFAIALVTSVLALGATAKLKVPR
ncbi:MAG: MFS transporter [Pseudomonadota bacterium]